MPAYYNENDPFAAQWLRNLIAAGHIADGEVDERDIRDVTPKDLAGFDQHHFFAGIGVWSYALRRAGWPDERPVWTGSCPCQPFSQAGKGDGFSDERHLWPYWLHLIEQCRPGIILGEQVASKHGLAWLDLVQADMEGTGHTFGAVDLCAAGVGAPHIRQRLFWVAVTQHDRRKTWEPIRDWSSATMPSSSLVRLANHPGEELERQMQIAGREPGPSREGKSPGGCGHIGGLENHFGDRRPPGRHRDHERDDGRELAPAGQDGRLDDATGSRHIGSIEDPEGNPRDETRLRLSGEGCGPGGVDDAHGRDASAEGLQRGGQHRLQPQDTSPGDRCARPGPTNGMWGDADWLHCRDGKWRPVEPGTFPLAHGAPARVGRLRGYGNAINAEVATTFIRAVAKVI